MCFFLVRKAPLAIPEEEEEEEERGSCLASFLLSFPSAAGSITSHQKLHASLPSLPHTKQKTFLSLPPKKSTHILPFPSSFRPPSVRTSLHKLFCAEEE